MEISIQQLLSSYCQELNQSWTETVAPLKDQQISFENIKPFLDKFREAEREGYSFELVFCPLSLINKIDSNNSFDKEMMESVNWRDIDVINNMKKQGKENDWNPMDKMAPSFFQKTHPAYSLIVICKALHMRSPLFQF